MSLVITVLVLGLLASLSPSTIVVFILLLATTRASVNAAAFLIGWTISLVLVFLISYEVGGQESLQHGSGRTAVDLVEIALGAALLLLALRQWRGRFRPRVSTEKSKRIGERFRRLNPWQAAGLGVLEEPWTLTAAAAVVVVRHHSAALIAVSAFVVFMLVSTATVGLTYLYFALHPEEAQEHLAALKERVVHLGPSLFAIVSAVVGCYLVADGILAIANG